MIDLNTAEPFLELPYHFDFDYDKMVEDFWASRKFSTKFRKSMMHMVSHITFSDQDTWNCPSNLMYSSHLTDLNDDFSKTANNEDPEAGAVYWPRVNLSYNAKNIRRYFKLRETERAVKQIDQWLQTMDNRLTMARYYYCPSHYTMEHHRDGADPEQCLFYHIPIKTSDAVIFQVGDIPYRMNQLGHIYRIRQDVEHHPDNPTDDFRLHLAFKTAKILDPADIQPN